MILDISRFWSIVITTHWACISDQFIFQIHDWFLCELLLIYYHMSMPRLVITFLLRCPRLAQTSTGSTIQVMDENQVKFRFQHVPTGPQKVGGVPALCLFLRFWFIGLAQGGKKSTFTRNLDISWWKTMVFPGFPLDFPSKGPHSPDFGPWLVRLAAAIAQVQLQLHQVHTTCDLGPWNLDGSHIQKKMLIPSDMDMFNMYIYIYVCVCLCIYIYIPIWKLDI